MKALHYILAAAAVILASCVGHSGSEAVMDRADAVMEERPDSAMKLLQGIDSSTLRGDEEKARYALLLTLARYKNYIDITEDSLVNKAEEYYSHQPLSREKMLASFCKACAEYEAERFDTAIRYAEAAVNASHQLRDTLWIARNCEVASNIYARTYSYRESADLMAEAAEMYGAVGKTLSELYAKHDLALALSSLKHHARSVGIVDSLLLVSNREFPHDTALQSDILSLALRVYQYAGEYDKALDAWRKRESVSGVSPLSVADMINGAYIALKTGSPDVAEELTGNIPSGNLSLNERINVIALNYSIGSYTGDTRRALSMADSIFSFIDMEIIGIADNPVMRGIGEFHRDQSEVYRGRSKVLVRRIVVILLVFGGIAMVTFSLVYALSRYRRLQMKAVAAELAWMTDLNSTLEAENKSLSGHMGALTSENDRLRGDLDTVSKTLSSLEDEKDLLSGHIGALTSENDRLRGDLDTVSETLSTLEAENKSLSGHIGALTSEKERLCGELSTVSGTLSTLEDTLTTLYLSHIRTVNSLSVQFIADDEAVSSDIKDKIKMELKILRDRKKLMQLSEIVNSMNGGIIDNIKERMPDISDIDLTLTVLTIAGLSGKIISVITGLPLNTVYTKRRRAFERIEEANIKGWDDVIKGRTDRS